MQDTNAYYDFDIAIEPILLQNGMVDDLFYLKDLKRRKLFLNEAITQDSVMEVAKHILQYNAEDRDLPPEERQPILLYVVSGGGEAQPGIGLIDCIRASVTPVYTVNLGFQYSMGFLIGLAGHKRFAMPNATYLMHDGSSMVYDSGAKAQDQMAFHRRMEERIRAYILERSNLTEEEYDSKFRMEWYLFPDEAKEKGFVDYIVGADCPMDAVI